MKSLNWITVCVLFLGIAISGCTKPADKKPAAGESKGATTAPAAGEHIHGTGPNGGVVFDLGGNHAEFTVDHGKQQCQILILGADEKTPTPVAATEFVLVTLETKTAEGKVVPPMTVAMKPTDTRMK